MDLEELLEAAFCTEAEHSGADEGEAGTAPAAGTPRPAKRQRRASPSGSPLPGRGQQEERAEPCIQGVEQQQQQHVDVQLPVQQWQQQAEQTAVPATQLQGRGLAALLELNDLLLLRILSHLCPDDLLSAIQTCKLVNAVASDAALWRRLYHARWPDGPQQEDAEHVQGSSWRVLYIERDAQSVLEARSSAPSEEMLPIYVQMATARRSEALSIADAEKLFRSPANNNRSLELSSKVEAFRRRHNLLNASHHATHSCCAKHGGCKWTQLDSTAWICERSGFVHVCDANCAFRELDPAAEGYVCQVSGRCFAAEMLTEREEHAGDEERGQSRSGRGGEQPEEEDWAAEDGVSGRLGRAFVAGYNTQTPEAFYRQFGVRW